MAILKYSLGVWPPLALPASHTVLNPQMIEIECCGTNGAAGNL